MGGWRHRPGLRLPILAVSLVLGLPGLCAAQGLTELFTRALSSNAEIAAARAAIEVANAEIQSARTGLWRPSIDIELDGTHERIHQSLEFSADVSETLLEKSATLSLSLPVFDGGETAAEVGSAKFTRDAAQSSLAETEQSVFTEIATAYGDLLMNVRLTETGSQILQDYQRLQQRLEDMRARNLATETELLQVKSEVADARANVASYQSAVRIARITIESLAGSLDYDPRAYPRIHTPETLEASLQLARTNNPSVRTAEFDLLAGEKDVVTAEAGWMPSVSMSGGYELTLDNKHYSGTSYVEHDSTRTFSLGVTVSIPIYDAGETSASVREARGTVAQLRDEFREAQDSAAQDATTAWLQMLAARDALEYADLRYAEKQQIYLQMSEQFEDFRADLVDLLTALNNVYATKQEREDAQYDLFGAQIAMLAATGQLNSAGLGLASPVVPAAQE